MINKFIQNIFKLAIKHTIPMPLWFIDMYLRSLSNGELITIKNMCYKAKENNQ